MGMEEQPRCDVGGQGSSSPAAPDGCQGSVGIGCCSGSSQSRARVSSSQIRLWALVPVPRAARAGDEPWNNSTWGLPAPWFSDGLGQETRPHCARPPCHMGRQGARRASLGSHPATVPLPNRKNMAKCGLFLQNDPKKPTTCLLCLDVHAVTPPAHTSCASKSARVQPRGCVEGRPFGNQDRAQRGSSNSSASLFPLPRGTSWAEFPAEHSLWDLPNG